MRVVLLPSAYTPAVGGVEVLTARLAHHLMLLGHEVEVWTGRSNGDLLSPSETVEGIPVRRFVFAMPRASVGSAIRTPLAAFSTLQQLRAAVRDFKPDVLNVQCFSGNGAYAAALSRMTGVPLVVTLQGETLMDDHDIYEHSMTLRASLRLGLRRAAAVTGCSAFTLNDVENRFGLDMRKAQVIFNGVDHEAPSERVELPFQRYVLGLGRVVRKKGFDLLLEAFARLSPKHLDVGLVIAGDGPERETLQQRVVELGLVERVHLSGSLRQSQVAAVMNGAEVFVMPSRIEPFGIVVLEAWRAAVPTVVTSHGGPPEFVRHGENGLVVDPLDSILLSASMETLLVHNSLRARLANAGKEEVRLFDWSKITAQYDALYRLVACSGASAPRA
jgi:glycosyltransferase involved in cell wall biosynthesis